MQEGGKSTVFLCFYNLNYLFYICRYLPDMMRREGYDPNHYTISRRGKRMKQVEVARKRRKINEDGNSDDSEAYETDGSGNEYEENGIKVQKFNPWQADIHYGLTVDSEHPASRG